MRRLVALFLPFLLLVVFLYAIGFKAHAQDVSGAVQKLNEAIALLKPQAPVGVTVPVPAATAQQAIAAAPAGAVLVLEAGAAYPDLVLSGPGHVLTSAASIDGRVSPTAVLPKVAHLDVTGIGWTIRGVEVTGNLTRVESVWCDPAARDITFDQVLIRGRDPIRHGIALNCVNGTVTRSYIYDFKTPGVESKAINAWLSPGPLTITDNYLSAASVNVLIGGGNVIPTDVLVARNVFEKPEAWRGQALNVKNLFEVKTGRRVTVEDNVLTGSWRDGQSGYGIVLTVRDQYGDCSTCTIADLIVRRNTVAKVGAGIQILGLDDSNPSVRGNNWLIDQNVIAMAPQSGDAARFLQIQDAPTNLVITNNVETLIGWANSFLYLSGLRLDGFTFTGNDVVQGEYGVFGENSPGLGKRAIDYYAPGGYAWSAVTVRQGTWIPYPAGTTLK